MTCFQWFDRSIVYCHYVFSDSFPMIWSINILLSLRLQWLVSHDLIDQYFIVLTTSVTCFPWFDQSIFDCPYSFSDSFPMIWSVNILLSVRLQRLISNDLISQYFTVLTLFFSNFRADDPSCRINQIISICLYTRIRMVKFCLLAAYLIHLMFCIAKSNGSVSTICMYLYNTQTTYIPTCNTNYW